MSDRTAQARAEAERRWPGQMALAPVMKARFLDGVEWADANHPAVDALARVRELHTPEPHNAYGLKEEVCQECSAQDSVRWPCETYEATEVEG